MKNISLLEECARVTGNGNIYIQLAEKYLQTHEWGKAVLSLESAFYDFCLLRIVEKFGYSATNHIQLQQSARNFLKLIPP